MGEIRCGPYSDPLKKALELFDHDMAAIRNSRSVHVLTVKFPQNSSMRGRFVTGLSGILTTNLTVHPHGDRARRTFSPGEPWVVRWDFDEAKGSHVNVSIGRVNAIKFSFETTSRIQSTNRRYLEAIQQQSQAINFNPADLEQRGPRFDRAADFYGARLLEWWRRHCGPPPNWNIYSGGGGSH
ncbi:hypothetical protein EJ04DRAFT_574079 [Polyplosphaeria fusca]|uniref:Uncharacterized protein n=1 Tax=Polyplosphaeria fusca TaxID=682080 RepID=A0A9P4V4U3_9PLEO|nr:hypothetical protein EJ04DRAFT_574079 [Polyplosphaeria fusca]